MNVENNRILKNTIYLYIRQIVVLGISLYTSRIILDALGVTDFGLYNVVGGVIVLFSFITSALSNSTGRFFSYAIGKGDVKEIETTFGTFRSLYDILALAILILGETVGLWFVYHYLKIPEDRFTAALWVYHFSVLATVMNVIYLPYQSLIISNEKMSVFAYVSIMEASLKLGIVFLLYASPFDRLIVYAVLIFLLQFVIRCVYTIYCKRKIPTAKAPLTIKKDLVPEVLKYSGWVLFGSSAYMTYTQGLNILLNIFFGPAVNAARGIAVQVQTGCQNFIVGFQSALYPQLIKSFAKQDLIRMRALLYTACKGSFFLFLLLVLPILLKTGFILDLWLKEVPDYAIPFTQLILVFSMLRAITNSLNHAVQATGKIRAYQLVDGLLGLSILPIAYVVIKLFHTDPVSVFWVLVSMEAITVVARIIVGVPRFGKVGEYLKNVLFPVIYVTIIGAVIPVLVAKVTSDDFWGFIYVGLADVLWTMPIVFFLGLNSKERSLLLEKIPFIKKRNKQN